MESWLSCSWCWQLRVDSSHPAWRENSRMEAGRAYHSKGRQNCPASNGRKRRNFAASRPARQGRPMATETSHRWPRRAQPTRQPGIRAPFAGVLRVEAVESKIRLGASVEPHDTLAIFDARFTPTEALDLKTKLVEAEARHKSAENVVKIRQERLGRLDKLPVGLLSQDEADRASVQLSKARMQANVCPRSGRFWKQALEAVGKKTVTVPIQSPMAGEIAEIGVQPGTNVDAGQMHSSHRRFSARAAASRLSERGNRRKAADSGLCQSTRFARCMAPVCAAAREPGAGPPKSELVLRDHAGRIWSITTLAGRSLRNRNSRFGQARTAGNRHPVPASLVHQGRTLVYIEKRLGRYERREVELLGCVGATLYVAAEGWLASADRVVTSGAQVLLSEEFRNEVDDD